MIDIGKAPVGILNFNPGLNEETVLKIYTQLMMEFFQGNKTRAAIAMGISVSTLDRRLDKYHGDIINERIKLDQIKRNQEDISRRLRGLPVGSSVYQDHQINSFGIPQAEARVHVEPAAEISKEQSVPVPDWSEVQALPSQPAPGHRERKRRSNV